MTINEQLHHSATHKPGFDPACPVCKPADVRVQNHISLVLVRPLNDAADQWLREHVQADATWFNGSVVVEPRYLDDLVAGMIGDGLEVR